MHQKYHQIIDANVNRVAEGLRVIEDYTRFISKQKASTVKLAKIRKEINETEKNHIQHLLIRDTSQDMRAAEIPSQRKDTFTLLKANFKRVEEGLRVLEEYTGNAFYNKIRYEMYSLEKEIILTSLKKTINPGIYLISDEPKILEQGLKWKVSCIQLRDKKNNKEIILKNALILQKKAKAVNIPFIVNDYLDIALLSDADGLHTGQDDLDIPSIRKILGPHKIIGRSTHTIRQGLQAQKEGADYVSVGPIWSTSTKQGRPAIGFDYLKHAKKQLAVPYVAIGGININTIAEIASFRPQIIGLVRGYEDIPAIQKKFKTLFRISKSM